MTYSDQLKATELLTSSETKCEKCGGTGMFVPEADNPAPVTDCPACGGNGYIPSENLKGGPVV